IDRIENTKFDLHGGERLRKNLVSTGGRSCCTMLDTAVKALGAKTFPNSSLGWVNVKDVANAHIQAFEIPSAEGRYCLVERVAHSSEVVDILRKLYPSYKLPEKCADDDQPFRPTYQISQEKAKTLGIDFIPLEESIKETVESLKEKGFYES
ncbi:hypothetical protein RJ639_015793, partial [Escallonia herrerae]